MVVKRAVFYFEVLSFFRAANDERFVEEKSWSLFVASDTDWLMSGFEKSLQCSLPQLTCSPFKYYP